MYDELVKMLRKHYIEHCPMDRASGICGGVLANEAADAIEELSKRLDESIPKGDAEIIISEVAKPRWIPVTERLPQEREWVLCQCRAKIRMVLRLQNGYWHQDSRHEFMSGFVTHWMPLPEPPKEET